MPDGAPLCSCGQPRGTRKDGSPRKDRYCAECRRRYEKSRRAASKQQFQDLVAHAARLERVLQERNRDDERRRRDDDRPGY